MSTPKNAILFTPHNKEEDYHRWVLIPGFKGQPVEVTRDSLGRSTKHAWRKWLVLICNNSSCPARMAVRSEHIEDIAEALMPVPRGESHDRD